jgi:hypothetical protein
LKPLVRVRLWVYEEAAASDEVDLPGYTYKQALHDFLAMRAAATDNDLEIFDSLKKILKGTTKFIEAPVSGDDCQ